MVVIPFIVAIVFVSVILTDTNKRKRRDTRLITKNRIADFLGCRGICVRTKSKAHTR